MSKQLFVAPAEGRRVRDANTPGYPLIPPEGKRVELTQYIMRRLRSGDLVIVEAEASGKSED